MAIAFNCPYCQLAYRLPDKMAGKQAKCKNPECRKVITIPAPEPEPVAIPAHLLRGPSTAMVERAALDALSDEPPKITDAPVEEKVIPMTCTFCDHKWTEPWSKAGKNTLCPNPECRQRQKVPEPKEVVPTNWRQPNSKLPTLAKQNFEELDNVMTTTKVGGISKQAAEGAGLLEDLYEPKSYKLHIYLGIAIVGLLSLTIYGIVSWRSSRIEKGEDQLMVEARKEFDAKAVPADYTTPYLGLSSAVLHAAEAEYTLTLVAKDPKKLKEAQDLFDQARNEVRKQPPGLERYAVASEFALAVLDFAGTEEQVKEKLRYRWQPDTEAKGALKLNENSHTVFQELSTTLQLLQGADFEQRITTARRLTRRLAERGQASLAADLLPPALFSSSQENAEARAVIALEIYRVDPTSPVPKQVADELKTSLAGGVPPNPFPASAQTLFLVLATDKAPVIVPPPAPNGPLSAAAVLAYTGVLLLEGKPDAAIALANRTQTQHPEVKLKALLLCAEWSKEPGAALDAAAAAAPGTKQPAASSHILRLSQLAAINGKHDLAKSLADSLSDDGLKAWAKGEAVRQRIVANPKEKADENWVEVPDEAKKMRVGYAWGRLWVARANAKESSSTKEKKATANWPVPVRPFALAGIALGLHDR
ncbi:MAG: hypothetical protein K8U57_25550 [Planctomycetes bacterium]|nr:hypothetical protein [Planctomycetota bacterium]